jgi:hypothetical protein
MSRSPVLVLKDADRVWSVQSDSSPLSVIMLAASLSVTQELTQVLLPEMQANSPVRIKKIVRHVSFYLKRYELIYSLRRIRIEYFRTTKYVVDVRSATEPLY